MADRYQRSEAVCSGTKGYKVSTERTCWNSQSAEALVCTPDQGQHPRFVVRTVKVGRAGLAALSTPYCTFVAQQASVREVPVMVPVSWGPRPAEVP